LDKVAATTNILQHESKDSALFESWLGGSQNLLMIGEIKHVMHGLEQGGNSFVVLILFHEFLPSR
jgi:hypothetical protein